jgi:hypothetical protein
VWYLITVELKQIWFNVIGYHLRSKCEPHHLVISNIARKPIYAGTWHQNATFFLWLAMKNRYWTADSLGKRGLPHPMVCLLCDQEQETIQHLLKSCIFARQFWHNLSSPFGLGHHAGYWCSFLHKVVETSGVSCPKSTRKWLKSAIILGA